MSSPNTHIVNYRGSSSECTEATYEQVCQELIQKHGPPTALVFPRITPLRPTPFKAPEPVAAPEPVTAAPEIKGGDMDLVAAARIARFEDIALTAGFAPKPPIYSAGTRVLQLGVENATRMQLTHDAKPTAVSLALGLQERVLSEERKDLPPTAVSLLRMTKHGLVVLPNAQNEPGRGAFLPISSRAFGSLFAKMPCSSGISYLSDCTPELRAINFNHWAVELGRREAQEKSPTEAVLRTRKVNGHLQAYATVSPSYTAFDADKIGQALALAFPSDARGSLDYDGQRMRLEGLWRANIAAGEFAAGEFFKAGVIVRTDDTGGGSIRVQSVLWRNLCLNLIILDKAVGVDIRIRHQGSVETLAAKFRAAFDEALASVERFRLAWGYARTEPLVERTRAVAGDEVCGMSATDMLPGILNGILEQELVRVPGRRQAVIPKLLEMHRQDEAAGTYGVSRASIINAFTRYSHIVETDAFVADEIREGAGSLLSGYRGGVPRPLPYVAL